jgi:hypothetical protein
MLQYSTTYRNATLDLLDTIIGPYQVLRLYTGPPPPDCLSAASGTLLVEFDLQQPSWDPAIAGSKSLADITITTLAIAAGVIGHFRLYDGAASICHIQGTVTMAGDGGDAIADNLTIVAVGQVINTTQFTFSASGA